MTWWLWLLTAYAVVSILIGAMGAWVAWDHDPMKTFFVVALSWPVLVVAWAVG